MPINDVVGLPGVRAPYTAAFRRILAGSDYTFLPGGRVIDGTNSRDPGNTPDVDNLRPGLLMGLITATSLYAPSAMDTLVSGGTVGSTALTISAAGAVELVRRIGATGTFRITGPNIASGSVGSELVVYSAVNVTTGVITCTATTNAYIAGSLIQANDGSNVPTTFIPDGWGLKVTDNFGVQVASVEFPQIPVAGIIDQTQLLPWPADPSLRLWIEDRLSTAQGGKFVFAGTY